MPYKIAYRDRQDEIITADKVYPDTKFFSFRLGVDTVAYIAADSIVSVKLIEAPKPLVSSIED